MKLIEIKKVWGDELGDEYEARILYNGEFRPQTKRFKMFDDGLYMLFDWVYRPYNGRLIKPILKAIN